MAAPKVDLSNMPLEDKVRWFYEHGSGSIQDIARTHHIGVEEVLHIIGQDEMTVVTTTGDLVDRDEAGPGAVIDTYKQHHVSFTTD